MSLSPASRASSTVGKGPWTGIRDGRRGTIQKDSLLTGGDRLPPVRTAKPSPRLPYLHVRQRTVGQSDELEEHEHLPRWLDDERLPAAQLQDPDQRTHPRGVHEGHSREVYQDARTGGFHHRFGGLLLEWIRGREVDLAMREESLGGPGESPGVRHRPGLGLVFRYGERKSRKVTRLPKA